MNVSPVQWISRARSSRLALEMLDAVPGHALLILPSTRRALALARELCAMRECCVMTGPISSGAEWQFRHSLRTPLEVVKAYIGKPELPQTVISFPDQVFGSDSSFAWLPFLGSRYAFSVIEALLALRHQPQVFGLRTQSPAGDFGLTEVAYGDLLDARTRMASLHVLMSRLLGPLEAELAEPPQDWLAARWFAQKSEAHWRFRLREELKEMECLLRLHLLSPACDQLRAGTAVRAVVARQKYVLGAVSP